MLNCEPFRSFEGGPLLTLRDFWSQNTTHRRDEKGFGLYAREDIARGRVIARFTGAIVTERSRRADSQAVGLHGGAMMERPVHNTMIGRDGAAWFANNMLCEGKDAKNNACLSVTVESASIKAARRIHNGEEIFVSYGPKYWTKKERKAMFTEKVEKKVRRRGRPRLPPSMKLSRASIYKRNAGFGPGRRNSDVKRLGLAKALEKWEGK